MAQIKIGQAKEVLDYIVENLAQGIEAGIKGRSEVMLYSKGFDINLVVANRFQTVADFKRHLALNLEKDIATSPVFYVDQKTAYVRVNPCRKSLKRLSLLDKNRVFHLRDMEREIGDRYNYEMVYFFPEQNSLHKAKFENLMLDRSHLRLGDNGYEKAELTEVAKTYKIRKSSSRIELIDFEVDLDSGLARIVSKENKIKYL